MSQNYGSACTWPFGWEVWLVPYKHMGCCTRFGRSTSNHISVGMVPYDGTGADTLKACPSYMARIYWWWWNSTRICNNWASRVPPREWHGNRGNSNFYGITVGMVKNDGNTVGWENSQ